ncbi:hypothetical protein [Paenibacillus eucommiae]|uniref:Uncharacterized protein n=1 Tax=Paenibacillus eucommiae TaxID=1355755 RepID=A0ABS4JAQ0_9BACL|nr:hypothetical protein [Paenibacillus eucommiae]MBP1996920.1 hypothetical protein [Paenibacillus eucommiae]
MFIFHPQRDPEDWLLLACVWALASTPETTLSCQEPDTDVWTHPAGQVAGQQLQLQVHFARSAALIRRVGFPFRPAGSSGESSAATRSWPGTGYAHVRTQAPCGPGACQQSHQQVPFSGPGVDPESRFSIQPAVSSDEVSQQLLFPGQEPDTDERSHPAGQTEILFFIFFKILFY